MWELFWLTKERRGEAIYTEIKRYQEKLFKATSVNKRYIHGSVEEDIELSCMFSVSLILTVNTLIALFDLYIMLYEYVI